MSADEENSGRGRELSRELLAIGIYLAGRVGRRRDNGEREHMANAMRDANDLAGMLGSFDAIMTGLGSAPAPHVTGTPHGAPFPQPQTGGGIQVQPPTPPAAPVIPPPPPAQFSFRQEIPKVGIKPADAPEAPTPPEGTPKPPGGQ